MKKRFTDILILSQVVFYSGKDLIEQTFTLDEVSRNFMDNPRVFGDSVIRRNCFNILDIS
jgi:hypothetical protein